jgi:hypothetical protein
MKFHSNLRLTAMLLASLLVASCRKETTTTHYSDISVALRDGAADRGWIPDFLPAGSTNIFEQHDLDTNRGVIALSAPPLQLKDLAACLERLNEADFANVGPWLRSSDRWWPADLKNKQLKKFSKEGFGIYRRQMKESELNRAATWIFAINPETGLAYVWH